METNKRVLVVDDDDVFRSFTARFLASTGYVAAEAQNGATALEKLETFKPDLVLLDLYMPVLDGWGVLDQVSRMAVRPRVVLVTGMRDAAAPEDPTRWIIGYLVKPFRVGHLAQTCERALARPPANAGGERRKTARRAFITAATVSSADGTPLTKGLLVEVSTRGVRLELAAAPDAGSRVKIAFAIPGGPDPVGVDGVVRWTTLQSMGVEAVTVPEDSAAVLRALVASA